MRHPEFVVVGECFENDLGTRAPEELLDVLSLLMNSVAANEKSGQMKNPSCMELTPAVIVDELRFILQAWHETNAPAGNVGVTRRRDTSFTIGYDRDILFLQNEKGITYPLDDDSAVYVRSIAETATKAYLDSI